MTIRQTVALEKGNKLQQEMVKETKTNNEVTSNHNKAIRLLTLVIVVVSVISSFMINRNKTGRYAFLQPQRGFFSQITAVWEKGKEII